MKQIFALSGMFIVAACTSSIQLYERDLPKQQRDQLFQDDIDRAREFVGSGHLRGCIDVFKARMHDPESLEVVQLPALDRELSRYTWGVSWGNGAPFRVVVFSGAVRGNNTFGGKVLTNIQCEFNMSDTDVSFYRVRQQ